VPTYIGCNGNLWSSIMGTKLEGKIAVITGATSGMALATAKLFVEEGAYLFITGRRQEQLAAAVKEIGKNVTGVQGDAGNLADLDRLYETVEAKKYRGEFRQHLQRQCQGHAVHGSEGAAADEGRRLDHHDRLDRQREGFPWLERLQREQGRDPLFCAHLDY
jgi:NAD(P)-dependent dehydrogenase (short-subunit alcohol dehydrogenase family)